MKKEEIASIAQLLTAMKDAVNKIKEAQKKKDSESLNAAKQEIIVFQKKIEEILKK